MSSDTIKLGAVNASTLAAVNAVVASLGQGHLVSQCEIDTPFSLFWRGKDAVRCNIKGRSDTGKYVFTSNIAIYKANVEANTFPIEKVYVSIHNPEREGFADEHSYFECMFGPGGIVINPQAGIPQIEMVPYSD
ncbi:MAG: hypothetical protein V4436_03135 [Patescibacteria group bacterium]